MKIFKNILISILVVVSLFVCVTLSFYNFCCEKVVVVGTSMYPTLHEGELGIMVKKPFVFSLERNDIIVFEKGEEKTSIVKRVIGLPGEKVEITVEGKILINDQEIPQPYLQEDEYNYTYKGNYLENMSLTLSDNEYYVLGDHRSVSLDSRIEGPVKGNQILGKVIFTYAKYKEFDTETSKGNGKTYFPFKFL